MTSPSLSSPSSSWGRREITSSFHRALEGVDAFLNASPVASDLTPTLVGSASFASRRIRSASSSLATCPEDFPSDCVAQATCVDAESCGVDGKVLADTAAPGRTPAEQGQLHTLRAQLDQLQHRFSETHRRLLALSPRESKCYVHASKNPFALTSQAAASDMVASAQGHQTRRVIGFGPGRSGESDGEHVAAGSVGLQLPTSLQAQRTAWRSVSGGRSVEVQVSLQVSRMQRPIRNAAKQIFRCIPCPCVRVHCFRI